MDLLFFEDLISDIFVRGGKNINFDGDKMVTLSGVSTFIQSLKAIYNLQIDLLLSLSSSFEVNLSEIIRQTVSTLRFVKNIID